MSADEVIEYSSMMIPYKWDPYPDQDTAFELLQIPRLAFGVSTCPIPGVSTHLFHFRRMPRDPLLRELVLANLASKQNPETLHIPAVSDRGLSNNS